jgi:hypothetical protein
MPTPIAKDAREVINTNASITGGLLEIPKTKLERTAERVTVPITSSIMPKIIMDQ